jgi:alkanesulfonate monooxygenase SsuD/methylene tetrahydromethanopterin reductase-like flavin-dependent oxidoreductase (luciferase family)
MDAWPSEIEHMLWQAKVADEGGFDSIWLTEHHFSHWSSASAPSVILTQMAAITKRVRVGYGIALVPFHQPVDLVSQMLWVDQFSKGRLNVGLGRGHVALEAAAFGSTEETNRRSFEEAMEIIVPALEGRPVPKLDGQIWKVPNLEISPGPYQKPRPPLYIVTTSDASMRYAVKWRAHPILGIDAPADLKRQLDRFRELCVEEGLAEEETERLAAKAKCTRKIVVSRSREEANEESLRSLAELHQAYLRGLRAPDDPALWGPWKPVTAADFSKETAAPMRGGNRAHVICGTPDDAVEQIRALEAETGIHYISTAVSSPGIDRAFCERAVTLLVEEVLPRV